MVYVPDKEKKREQAREWWRKYGRSRNENGERSIFDPGEDQELFFKRDILLRVKSLKDTAHAAIFCRDVETEPRDANATTGSVRKSARKK